MEKGWIKIHRIFTDWEWFRDSQMVHLFLFLVIAANSRDGLWRGIVVKKGQMITGRKELSNKTGMPEQTIRTCLSKLKLTNEITIESTNKYSIITINKYDQYQSHNQLFNVEDNQNLLAETSLPKTSNQPLNEPIHNHPANHQLTSNQPATNQQLTTNKNNKNNKKYKNIKNSTTTLSDFENFNFFEIFHSACPNLPKVLIQSEARKKLIADRLSDFGKEKLLLVFKLAGESDFLNGKNDKNWSADLDWILKPANFIKILENKYKNKPLSNENFKPNDPRASQAKGWDIPL